MLSERRRRVLEALIAEYVSSATPVGSRTLVERYPLGVSPATVRNELSVLEENGYITSPHVSAGRIPTDFGYRTFVDNLLEKVETEGEEANPFDRLVPADKDDQLHIGLVDELETSAQELDDLIRNISLTLTRFTNCLTLIMAPSRVDLAIVRVSLVLIESHLVVMVLVTEDGQVINKHVELSSGVDAEHLAKVEAVLNNILVGKRSRNLENDRDLAALGLLGDPFLNEFLNQILICLDEVEGTKVQHMGASALLAQPEFSDSHVALPVMELLDDNLALLQLLQSLLEGDEDGTSVRIGHENANDDLADISVVASRFGNKGEGDGVVAVVGPTRMDYRRSISAVRKASETLDKTVNRSSR